MDYAGFERMISPDYSLYAKLGYVGYRSHYKGYEDVSHGVGGEMGFHYYKHHRALEGWYLGGGLGYWSVRGSWRDDLGTPFVTTGKGEAFVADFGFRTGYMWYAGHQVYIDPSLGAGFLISNGVPDPFAGGGWYFNPGLAIGMRW